MNNSRYIDHYLKLNAKRLPSLERFKVDYIDFLLQVTNNNLSKTSEILNIPKNRLDKKIRRYFSWQ